jgi:hypothetical protein
LEYPRLEKMRIMVRFLSDTLDEARQTHGEQRLMVNFYDGEPESSLKVVQPKRDIAAELNLDGTEALGLFHDLSDHGYIDSDYGRMGRNRGVGRVSVTIRKEGRILIDQLPDPHTKLSEALEEILAAIEGLQGVDPAEQEQAAQGARQLRDFVKQLPAGAAVEVVSRLATVFGVPGGKGEYLFKRVARCLD